MTTYTTEALNSMQLAYWEAMEANDLTTATPLHYHLMHSESLLGPLALEQWDSVQTSNK